MVHYALVGRGVLVGDGGQETMMSQRRPIKNAVVWLGLLAAVELALRKDWASERREYHAMLDRVAALNQTTSALIAGTAQALRTQGVDIQTRAASTMLDMGQLEQAFADVLGAIDVASKRPRYIGRPEAAATATGLYRRHNLEQAKLIDEALSV